MSSITFDQRNAINSINEEIKQERLRQIEKWGVQDHDLCTWIAILTEEVGEASKEALDWQCQNPSKENPLENLRTVQLDRLKAYRKELIQVAAVAVQMIEAVDSDYLTK